MPRKLVDLDSLDLSKDVFTTEELRSMVPHREQFALLDGVCHFDPDEGLVVAYKDWPEDPWWGKGHIPGRPLMPGVLMIEGAAQAATILIKKVLPWESDRFVGLGGLDKVRFRGQVTPPARVYFVSGKGPVSGSRLAKFPAQAYYENEVIMDMDLLGVLI